MSNRVQAANLQDGRDVLDMLLCDLCDDNLDIAVPTRRDSANFDERLESTLVNVIEQRIQAKGLPLAMRKRLMYERSLLS